MSFQPPKSPPPLRHQHKSSQSIRSTSSQEFSAHKKPSFVEAPTSATRKPSGAAALHPQEALLRQATYPGHQEVLRKPLGNPREALRSSSSPPPKCPPSLRHPRRSPGSPQEAPRKPSGETVFLHMVPTRVVRTNIYFFASSTFFFKQFHVS